MGTKLWEKFKEIIYKDVSRESESNDLSVLLRCMAIAEILYLILLSGIMAYLNDGFLCLTAVFNVGIMAAVLILTYEDRSIVGMYLYIIVNHVFIAIYCLRTDWKYYYAPMILVCIMLFYFNARVSMKTKVYYSVGEAVFTAAVLGVANMLPMNPSVGEGPGSLIVILNILILTTLSSLEAYAYSLKYTRNEEKIIQYNKKLEDMVSTDALTGLWNRRAMNEHLSLLENGFRKHQKNFAVAILDIDFFKKVNDTYGHGMGDYVLKSLSSILKETMEGLGSVARWGGEEFLLTFEEMKFDEAVRKMDALREHIAAHEFAFKDVNLHLTVTGGIEDYSMTDSIDAVITKADERLYAGKTGGRNRIVSRD
ncbi:MAG: GGDEF domain-containing protein [Lachnospiraceae bacterium]|nr:GGDEF domain-containing protein [Lachnospiraceae bacterium]